VTAYLVGHAEQTAAPVVSPAAIHGDSRARRVVDVALGSLLLVLAAPLMLVIAILVRRGSPGPALFRQARVGRGGEPFTLLKFRSMRTGTGSGPQVSGSHDPRITRLGAVLRATKLDELPQLINVVRGDMTIIGPRAEVARYVEHYTDEERLLLTVRPGLTCPGQLHFTEQQADELDDADDPETFYVERQLHPKLALDLAYLRERSVRTDLRVLLATVLVLARALRPHRPHRPRRAG
jgi:lipopolysaccharide/colanic/teichoic acid biosynthesis glycosyltransferase